MMSNPDRDDLKAFKTIIEAFDQLNKERSHIINNQGQVISDFAERLVKYREKSDINSDVAIGDYIKQLNNGSLFSKATAKQSFQ